MVAIKGVLEDTLLSVMEGNQEDHLDKIVVFSYFNNNTTHICKVGKYDFCPFSRVLTYSKLLVMNDTIL